MTSQTDEKDVSSFSDSYSSYSKRTSVQHPDNVNMNSSLAADTNMAPLRDEELEADLRLFYY